MATDDVLTANRVLLTHFDSYSAALLFAKWEGGSLLYPGPLPETATLATAPAAAAAQHAPEAVKAALVEGLGINPDEVTLDQDFNHWADTESGPVRIHLLRFTCFEAPKSALAPHGAVFKPISELRGCNRQELALAREVFNLIIGAGGGRA